MQLASYLGVFATGSPPAYQPVARVRARQRAAQPDLVGYFSGWAEPFDLPYARSMHQHHIIPFVQIDPTFASVAAIAAGDYDSYLRSYADSVRAFGHPVVIGFGHEMNAPWYPWGYGHLRAGDLRGSLAAHRRRSSATEGADNVTWLWTDQRRPAGHRAGRRLVAGPAVRHLGRDRRLLLPPVRHFCERLRHDNRSGPPLHP